MNRDDVIRWAKEAGIEVHDRKQQARFGLDVITGEDSTEKLQRMCEFAAAAERRRHQADIELWKGEAAKAEKWRAMALGKDPMQPGKVVQEIQREALAAMTDEQIMDAHAALQARLIAAKDGLFRSRIGLQCSHCKDGKYHADGNGYHEFHRCDKCRHVPMWKNDGSEWVA